MAVTAPVRVRVQELALALGRVEMVAMSFRPRCGSAHLPPMENRPSSLRGRSFRVLFTVDPQGRVMEVRTEPRIDESGYRRKFLDAMKRYRFNPAKRRDGTAVIGLATVTVTL